MKKMRLIFCIACLMSLLLVASSVSAEVLPIERDGADIIIKGDGKNADVSKRVALTLLDKNGSPVYFDSAAVEADGSYQFKISLKATESEESYSVLIDGVIETTVSPLTRTQIFNVLNGTSKEDWLSMLKEYQNALKLDMPNSFSELRSTGVDLFTTLISQADISDESAFMTELNLCSAIAAVSQANTGTVVEKLVELADELDIDADELTSLSSKEQRAFAETFTLLEINKKQDFYDNFEDALNSAEGSDKGEDSGGGSGGGSSGGGKVSLIASVPKNKEPINALETPIAAKTFKDLDKAAWAQESIEKLYKMGIVSGRGDGTFDPNASVKREEFVKMIVSSFALTSDAAISFKDVAPNAWYADYIKAAYGTGVISGMSEEYFGVGYEITREDCAAICYRILKAKNIAVEVSELSYADSDAIAPYAKEAVAAMSSLEILNGVGDDMFAPDSTCTRAMAAKIIASLLAYK
ncbi:MAG: S-layer homology domain-containing protein [Clostridia bacterium]|nr:S-layer homology domain-containing protein [Clostridia bacterium]